MRLWILAAALWLAPTASEGSFLCRWAGRMLKPREPAAAAAPRTHLHRYLDALLPPAPKDTPITVVDLGGANYVGEAEVGRTIIESLVARGHRVTYYLNDLDAAVTRTAVTRLKARWGDKVDVRELPGDYGSEAMDRKVASLKPDLVFLMNPGAEAIEGVGGTAKMAAIMGNMANHARHGLYFRTAFHEASAVEPRFQSLFPTAFFDRHFPGALSLGPGDPYRTEGVSIGSPRDHFIPSGRRD